jgi:hypothetical protein
MLGASTQELAFVAVLLVVVVLAQIAPKIGEAIAVHYATRGPGEKDQKRDASG